MNLDFLIFDPQKFKDDLTKSEFAKDFASGDKQLLIDMLIFTLGSIVLGGMKYGYWMLGIVGSGLIYLTMVLCYALIKNSWQYRMVVGLAQGLISAVVIQQHLGTPMSHLWYFVGFGMMIRYKDGITIVCSVLAVFALHVVGLVCDANAVVINNMPIISLNWGSWSALVYHGYYAVMLALLLIVLSVNKRITFVAELKSKSELLALSSRTREIIAERTKEQSRLSMVFSEILMKVDVGFLEVKDGVVTAVNEKHNQIWKQTLEVGAALKTKEKTVPGYAALLERTTTGRVTQEKTHIANIDRFVRCVAVPLGEGGACALMTYDYTGAENSRMDWEYKVEKILFLSRFPTLPFADKLKVVDLLVQAEAATTEGSVDEAHLTTVGNLLKIPDLQQRCMRLAKGGTMAEGVAELRRFLQQAHDLRLMSGNEIDYTIDVDSGEVQALAASIEQMINSRVIDSAPIKQFINKQAGLV